MPTVKWRSKEQILDDMAAAFLTLTGKDINDLNQGSVLRTLLSVMAEEHEETAYNIATAMFRASIRFAQGADLDNLAADEGLIRHTSNSATGYVQLTKSTVATGDSAVAAIGSITLSNGDQEYTNSQPCRIFTGATSWVVDDGLWSDINIPFVASSSGGQSNTGANTITEILAAPAGVDSVNNPTAFSGGRLAETDRDLRARISYERDRRAGGSRIALLAEMLRRSDVFSAAVYEWSILPSGSKFVKPSPGEIWAYAYPTFTATSLFSSGRSSDEAAELFSLTPTTLSARVRNALESVRAFPAALKVYEPYTVLVNVTIALTVQKSYRLTDTTSAVADISQRLRNYILQLKIGEPLSEGHVYALAGQVLPFKTAEVTFSVTRNRTNLFTEDVEGLINAEPDEIIKPYGLYSDFGNITITEA